MAAQLLLPGLAGGLIQLTGVRLSDDRRQKSGETHRLFTRQIGQFELQILWQQFPHEHRVIENLRREHPVAQRRRQMPGTLHHAPGMIGGNLGIVGMRCECRDRLFDVDEAQFPLLAADRHEHGIAQEAERTTALHPIGRIDHLDLRVVGPRLERGDEPVAGVGGEDRVDRLALVVGQRPERLAEWNRGLRVLDPLTG